jgi:hypothetical protein
MAFSKTGVFTHFCLEFHHLICPKIRHSITLKVPATLKVEVVGINIAFG